METRKRVLGQEHLDTFNSMGNLAATYMNQERRKEAKELQIEAVNQLRTTLGDGHPSTVATIANLASFREERRYVASTILWTERFDGAPS